MFGHFFARQSRFFPKYFISLILMYKSVKINSIRKISKHKRKLFTISGILNRYAAIMSKIKIEISVMLIKAVFIGFILLILIKKTNRITSPKKILFVLKINLKILL